MVVFKGLFHSLHSMIFMNFTDHTVNAKELFIVLAKHLYFLIMDITYLCVNRCSRSLLIESFLLLDFKLFNSRNVIYKCGSVL